jgi:hypothetical protein
MWNRSSGPDWKCYGFFTILKEHSIQYYRYVLDSEQLFIKRFKLNPFLIERHCTVLDYTFFVDRICDDIVEENKDLGDGGANSKVIKSLRAVRNILNNLNLPE